MNLMDMKRYKFLTICMCCIIIISSTIVPTFALTESEPSESVDQTSERLATLTQRVDDLTVQVSDLTKTVQTLCMQMSQFMVTTIPEEGNQVVDISDESIQGIAEAVTYASSITADKLVVFNGYEQYIPSVVDDFNYWVVFVKGSRAGFIYCFNELPSDTGTTTPDYVLKSSGTSAPTFVEGERWSEYSGSYDPSQLNTTNMQVQYSNFDMYYDGQLMHAADFDSGIAKKYVTLVTGFDDVTFEPIEIVNGSVTLPEPEKEGHVFLGWYSDTEYTNRITSNNTFDGDITLYAKWMEQPQMGAIHKSFFNSLVEVFEAEPVRYFLILIGSLFVIAILRKLSWTR